uniref:NADH dehydrogenase subunit 4L n=1 Tax=Hoplopleura sp. TaxID=2782173 RepID=A0A7S9A2X9_9NEOP|nr:NADH dehydrogenase subunit 4L [Hoplopleura sp.]
MLIILLTSVFLCLFKMLSSSKMTISLVAMEFTSASLLVGFLSVFHPSDPVSLAMFLIAMFACESVVALSLLGVPFVQGGPMPRSLSVSLL